MIIRDHESQLLQLSRRFDKHERQPSLDMPLYMAMKKRNARVIDLEAKDCVPIAVD
jgi:hypothetical protein